MYLLFWQTFIESLSNCQRDRLLLDVLCNGRGSLDCAKQLVANSEDPDPDRTANTNCPNWCICNFCVDMGNEEESKCCKNRSCVTSYELFRNIVLDREVLTIAIRARSDIRAENADYEMNSFRKAAYRQFILWKYGKLGKGNRRVCPSCLVRLVRQTYPVLDGQYMGFRRH
ncbi:P2X purinoceptor 7-like [Acropora muricata]|uniref:P2X purinoceptor 7-like n=1 Tax=Acropora muricata TaxID=159855 RepID=UPI0034E4BDAF